MTGPMKIQKAKSFYNEMKITVKCTFSEVSNLKLPVSWFIFAPSWFIFAKKQPIVN